MPAVRRRTLRTNEIVVELRVERVAGDVRDLGRQLGAALGDRQAAEHPLVDEAELVVAEVEADPQVALVGGAGVLHEELAAHPEVAEEGVAVVERAARGTCRGGGRLEPATGQGGGEAGGPRWSRRTGRGWRTVTEPMVRPTTWRVEAVADGLDLGQLGHGGGWSVVGRRRRRDVDDRLGR